MKKVQGMWGHKAHMTTIIKMSVTYKEFIQNNVFWGGLRIDRNFVEFICLDFDNVLCSKFLLAYFWVDVFKA